MSTQTSLTSPQRIVIVGGVAGGASAAARARRLSEDAEITVIERGPDVSFANCGLPYHIGGEIQDRSKLAVQTPQSLTAMLKLNVRNLTEAVSIDRDAKTLKIKDLKSGTEEDLTYDKLVLSPGASPLRPPLPGIELPQVLTLRNLQDMDRIKAAASSAQRVLIIGAGFIGLEMAEQLIHIKKSVTLVELQEQVLPQMDPEMVQAVQAELRDNGVNLVLGDAVESFKAAGNAVSAKLKSGQAVETDLIILSIGVRPESGLAKDAGLELGTRGHIKANAHLQTNDPDIYAIGDVCETVDPILGGPAAIPLGGPANRQGRAAADHMFSGDSARPYPGSIGTAIVRVFDVTAGVTGHTEKRLQQLGVDYGKTIVTDYNHAGYFPGATHVTVKLLWDKATGKILGGQAFGADGVDKRLDVLATAIKGKLGVEDLEHLELAYAPPFGSAKDVLNTAAFSANNFSDELVKPVFTLAEAPEGAQLIDVRPKEMVELQPIPGSLNIPFNGLRTRLSELDKGKPVVTMCALGKMSYFAARILAQNGFETYAHVGGRRVEPSLQTNESTLTPSTQSPAQIMAHPLAENLETIKLDACGLACPGPILKVKDAVAALQPGQVLEVTASDAGFKKDLPAFCRANGYECLDVIKEKGLVVGRVALSNAPAPTSSGAPVSNTRKGATLVCFSGDLDKAMATFIIANGAVAMGGEATIFFTFWGLNVLRKDQAPAIPEKTFMDKMFGWMLPQGPNKLPLSQMHMAGMGTAMMKQRMADKNLPNLPGLMQEAVKNGVRLVACTMSMDAMGIREEELIDGVELGGVAEFLGASSDTGTNLFI
ncbi:FAD-dependent oxidoreductase [Cerasicoccus maritimus]|uniref:FAD-dependent oxidoreductase n=1 Tax=Cerasicoccus maritimus TaxID=490089 RepID=UPI0028528806|nr:FAD-dependent oxidoreductase [Cerasicoccus maritimus]